MARAGSRSGARVAARVASTATSMAAVAISMATSSVRTGAERPLNPVHWRAGRLGRAASGRRAGIGRFGGRSGNNSNGASSHRARQ